MGIREEMEKFEESNIGVVNVAINNETGIVETTIKNLDSATVIYACNSILKATAKRMGTDIDTLLISMLATNQEMGDK